MYEKELLEFHICSYEVTNTDLQQLVAAMQKVYELRKDLPDFRGQ